MSLQLWDTETGELIWASTAEAAFQGEALFDDPVYLREAGLVTWGSIISDLTHDRTAFRYTPNRPPRFDAKAICFPSRDQTGSESWAGSDVKRDHTWRATSRIQTSQLPVCGS